MAVASNKTMTGVRKRNRSNSWLIAQARNLVPPTVALLGLLLLWQILCLPGSKGLPGPIQIVQGTWDPYIVKPLFDDGGNAKGLGLQAWASLQRVAIGFSLSAFVGIGLGIAIGTNKLLYRAFDPILQLLRTIPPLAWLPIALTALNNGPNAGIFVIFITSIWPILINTTVGVQQIPQDYINVKRVLKLSKKNYFFKILLPAALPYIFTGLRIGVGLSWLAIVAAEMLTGGVGIGFFIWDSYSKSYLDRVIVALVYVGVIGLILDRAIGYLATKIVAQD